MNLICDESPFSDLPSAVQTAQNRDFRFSSSGKVDLIQENYNRRYRRRHRRHRHRCYRRHLRHGV